MQKWKKSRVCEMKVIAVEGRNTSGKDELMRYLLENCDMPIVSAGDVARENLHEISQQMIRKHGEDFFMQRLIEENEKADWDLVGISGVRTPADVKSLKDQFGGNFLLVHVKVGDPHIRFERSKARRAKRDPQSYADFLEQDRSENELFRLDQTIQRSDHTILNNSDLEVFHKRIENEFINGILKGEGCSL